MHAESSRAPAVTTTTTAVTTTTTGRGTGTRRARRPTVDDNNKDNKQAART